MSVGENSLDRGVRDGCASTAILQPLLGSCFCADPKEVYVKEFLEQTPEAIADGSYDTSKIEAVLDMLFSECTAMALDQWESVG